MVDSAPLPLSRSRILGCALRIADQDGLEAASLRRVASELGVHVTSLYNHVATKEALLDGIVTELVALGGLPTGDLAWNDWVREFVDRSAAMARQHPGAFAVLLRRPVQGPEAAATFEAGIAAFHRAGMDMRDAYAAVKSVALAVLGCCVEQTHAAVDADLSTNLGDLPQESFPMLHGVSEVAADLDVVAALREVLIAGLGERLGQRR